jgi:voltage-gated potassium channel
VEVGPVERSPGQARSDKDAATLARFDNYMRLPIILAALIPLILVPETGTWLGALVDVVSWLVFLADFAVHRRRLVRYLSTNVGRFDLTVVVLTAPWFLLPGAEAGSFVVVLRLARLARVVMASRGVRRLLERLGRVAIVAVAVVVVGAAVAYYAEHATNPEFATYGDALWWGIVTLTTVGYGDIVPETTTGRFAGVAIMITGIAVVGLLAGSLASFFGLATGPDGESSGKADEVPNGQATADTGFDVLAREMAELRQQMARLTEQLGGGSSDQPPDAS